MKRVLIFSGTTEGKNLAHTLAQNNIPSLVYVATEYGQEVMNPEKNVEVKVGRLTEKEMTDLMEQEAFSTVVDATHPFAQQVSENVKNAVKVANLKYIRLSRTTENDEIVELAKDAERFQDVPSCVKALKETTGNILLTTGSKDLGTFCENEDLRSRLFVRVLPGIESIELCKKQNIAGKNIIAMQGPFSKELNVALIRQFDIGILVTKASGKNGGLLEKLQAVKETNIKSFLIENPEKTKAYDFQQTVKQVLSMYEGNLSSENDKNRLKSQFVMSDAKSQPQITLFGIGMGNIETMTVQGKNAIDSATHVFGAKRLLENMETQNKKYPYYLAKEIIPVINNLSSQDKVVVLFSGDSGFYSGTKKMLIELKKAGFYDIKVLPGISSVSYMASICQIPWGGAEVFSVHGRKDTRQWSLEIVDNVRHNESVFIILSGAADVAVINEALIKNGLDKAVIHLGYQLSYENESYVKYDVLDNYIPTEKGLYIMVIVNPCFESRKVALRLKDSEFLRGKVPMTKEEVRAISVNKLQLRENSVCYDIGSGSGSVAIAIAKQSPSIFVHAIEKKPEAVSLISENIRHFNMSNIDVIHENAPEGLENLPKATHAFIGGSGGNLNKIIDKLYTINPKMRVVINAISLETVAEITNLVKNASMITDAEIIQLQVARAEIVGGYHLMRGENPVYICSFNFT